MRASATFRILAAVFLLAVCGLAQAASQTVEFNSLNAHQGFSAITEGRAQYTDKISAVFTRPNNAVGNVPVMVIMHGGGGNLEIGTGTWQKFFLDQGVATFVVDSFGPRGINDTVSDFGQLAYSASAADALTALRAVSKLPGVDAKRVGIIGFSRGATAAQISSHENLRAAVLGANSDLRYAFHAAFYGSCNQVGTTTGRPIVFFAGDDDDYFSIETCRKHLEVMRSRGANMELVVYPGAKHSFDVDRKVAYNAKGQTWKKCSPRYIDLDNNTYSVDGKLVTAKEYGEFFAKCITHGISVGPNYPAIEDSRARVKALIRENFAL